MMNIRVQYVGMSILPPNITLKSMSLLMLDVSQLGKLLSA